MIINLTQLVSLSVALPAELVKILFQLGVGWWVWVGGKIIPRIRQTAARDFVEVEAELGKNTSLDQHY